MHRIEVRSAIVYATLIELRAVPGIRNFGSHIGRAEVADDLALSGLSLVGILLLLHADFRSPRLLALVFVSLPFALVGGVIATLLAGGVLLLGRSLDL